MTDYTANDLEREVLDPLFYRYERSIRAQVRLEQELARLRPLEAEVAILRRRTVTQDATSFRLEAEVRMAQPKLKDLYDAAEALLLQIGVPTNKNLAKHRTAIGLAAKELRGAMVQAQGYCGQIPF